MSDQPWGHKVTIHIYVKGDIADAIDVSDFYADVEMDDHRVRFVGASVDEVHDEPKGMGDA